MKIYILESHSTKSVTIICIDATFSSIVFIAYQTSVSIFICSIVHSQWFR